MPQLPIDQRKTGRQTQFNLLSAHPPAPHRRQRITHGLRLIGVISRWQRRSFLSYSVTFFFLTLSLLAG